jgi:hypothetical protein
MSILFCPEKRTAAAEVLTLLTQIYNRYATTNFKEDFVNRNPRHLLGNMLQDIFHSGR